MNFQRLTLCLATTGALSACSLLPRENAVARSEYKKDVVSCSELSGVEHSMCIQDANSEMDSAVMSAYRSAVSAAETNYKDAVQQCKEGLVDDRNDCLKSAETARAKALAKAESARHNTISLEKKPVAE